MWYGDDDECSKVVFMSLLLLYKKASHQINSTKRQLSCAIGRSFLVRVNACTIHKQNRQ